MRFRPLPYLGALAVTAVTYLGAARLGLRLGVVEQVSAVWPPTGIALAATLLLGYRVWPGILLGAVLRGGHGRPRRGPPDADLGGGVAAPPAGRGPRPAAEPAGGERGGPGRGGPAPAVALPPGVQRLPLPHLGGPAPGAGRHGAG